MMGEPEAVPQEVIHIAGQWARIDSRLRQRCSWCGATLIDVDLSAISFPIEQAEKISPDDPLAGYPVWPTGGLIARDGAASWVVALGPEDPLPPGCCGKLPPEATA